MSLNALDVFLEDFDFVLLKGLTAGLRDCYASTAEFVRDRISHNAVRMNTFPFVRRGLVEDMMFTTATQYGAGTRISQEFDVTQEPTTFWYHVEIKVGRVILTQAAISSEGGPIRESRYREELAHETQRLLFDDSHDIDPEGCLFATLLHNRDGGDYSKIGFAQIRFPRTDENGKLNGYHDGKIDLRAQFSELFEKNKSSSTEQIPDSAMPTPITEQKNVSKAE